MKVFAIADLESDWYPKNAFLQFKRYSSLEFVDEPEDTDIIWIFSYYQPIESLLSNGILEKMLFFKRYRERKTNLRNRLVIASFHHLYKPKEGLYLSKVKQIDKISDVIHFFSEINVAESQDYFKSPIILLPYWIDTTLFRPLPSEQKRQVRRFLDLPDNRIILGSFQRDTEADLISPKLEKGSDVFCDIIELLRPDRYFVLLAGPRRNYVESRLEKYGVPFKSLGKVSYKEMNKLYSCLDYYLVTSRCEGGPQTILETMATKTPIYSTRVGISNLLAEEVVFSSVDEFVKALKGPYPADSIETHYQTAQRYECSKVINVYEETLAKMYKLYRQNRKGFFQYVTGLNCNYLR